MKRNNCFFWKSAVLSALAVLTLGISAGAVEYSGTCGAEGSNAAWKLDAETGLMTISGQGALAEYNSSNPVPWEDHRKEITYLVVEEGITDIGTAFCSHMGLETVKLPDSVTQIDASAFSQCIGLTSVELSEKVTAIGADAFINCSKLTMDELPASLTTIGRRAFMDCGLSGGIEIPATVTEIGRSAFSWCSDLTSITVEEGNTAYCDVDGVLYTADMTTLLSYPCGREAVSCIFPEGVTTIGEYAVSRVDSLEKITLPHSLTTIERWAFRECPGFREVEIPEQVDFIGKAAFWGCTNLKMACFRGNAPSETEKNGSTAVTARTAGWMIAATTKQTAPGRDIPSVSGWKTMADMPGKPSPRWKTAKSLQRSMTASLLACGPCRKISPWRGSSRLPARM